MNIQQDQLIREVIDSLRTTPQVPKEGCYLPMAEAERIVDQTIDHVRSTGAAQEYVYLLGHRRRLAISLTMIPMASSPEATCLDVGCYGYMAYWAWRYLGYGQVEGIEMRPDLAATTFLRRIEMEGRSLDLKVHNFNLTSAEWPITGTFDTVLFFETLEHVDHDPSGVLLNVARCMHDDSMLVVSVPNAVSYKGLQEFVAGAPPWTYWFFNPDLSHEPRHSFEYTPIFFKMVLRCAGLSEQAFRTICAYNEESAVSDFFRIGAELSIEPSLFGETMIAQARKTSDLPLFRYPDCLYSGDRYYRTTYPAIRERMEQACSNFFHLRQAAVQDANERAESAHDAARQAVVEADRRAEAAVAHAKEEAQAEAERWAFAAMEQAKAEARRAMAASEEAARLAISTLEESTRQVLADSQASATLAEKTARSRVEAAEAAVADANRRASEAIGDKDRANSRMAEAIEQRREAIFLCEKYLERVRHDEAEKSLLEQEFQQRHLALQGQMDDLRIRLLDADASRQEFERQAAVAKALYQGVVSSTFWRATGPARRFLARHPHLAKRLRALLAPPARALRRVKRWSMSPSGNAV